MLYLCCGKLACGKSRWAEAFVKENPAVILSVDGLTIPLSDLLQGPVHDRVTAAVKEYLLSAAEQILRTGADVILDWGFWRRDERAQVRTRFEGLGFPVCLVYFPMTPSRWQANIGDRNRRIAGGGYAAYPVDEGLMKKCEALFQEPGEDETDRVVAPAEPEAVPDPASCEEA